MKTIYIEVEDEFHDRVKARAAHERRKLSVMCREVIAEYLDGGDSLVPTAAPKSRPPLRSAKKSRPIVTSEEMRAVSAVLAKLPSAAAFDPTKPQSKPK